MNQMYDPNRTEYRQKIFLQTNGCQTAKADVYLSRELLVARGYDLTDKLSEADVIALNLCSFQNVAREESLQIGATADSERKKGSTLAIIGCLARIDPDGVRQRIPGAQYALGEQKDLLKILGSNEEDAVPYREINNALELTVERSCISNCTFCAIKKGKSSLRSYSIKTIARKSQEFIDRTPNSLIKLIGEDVGAYGLDLGTNIVTLINELTTLQGEYNLQINVLNPWWFLHKKWGKQLEETLVEGMDSGKIIPYIALPLQSGSDKILQTMKRQYTAGQFEEIVQRLRKNTKTPLGIGTDIIVGFPGETEEDFKLTSDLVERVGFQYQGIWKYADMPGTEASKLQPKVSEEVKQERAEHMIILVAEQQRKERGLKNLNQLYQQLKLENKALPISTNTEKIIGGLP